MMMLFGAGVSLAQEDEFILNWVEQWTVLF
jgi:hypothetical protein